MKKLSIITLLVISIVFCFSISYALADDSATPVIGVEPVGATVNTDVNVELAVGATAPDGGTLSYQWYKSGSSSADPKSNEPVGTNSATYKPETSALGLAYYYVVVTNVKEGSEPVSAQSAIVPVLVTGFNLPDDLSITTIYEGDTLFNGGKVGSKVYQGGRVTLKTEYYTGIARPSDSSLSFEWYSCDNPDDPTSGRVRAATDKWDLNQAPILGEYDGNIYIPDTSKAGTNYYYAEMTFTPGNGVPVTIQSEIVTVKVESIMGTLEEGLLTPAELSGWRRTTSSAEVYAYCQKMAGLSEGRIRMVDMTETAGSVVSVGLRIERQEPKKVPMLIIGYPQAPASYEEAIADGKTIALVNCNIHSGEVEGKESMLIFAREVALGYHDDGLLKDMVILLIPNFNADGNDDLGTSRNNTQYTPRMMGTRYTGAMWNPAWTGTTPQTGESNNYIHYNINRDMTKLDGKESSGMVAVMNEWDPVIFIDAHATNGSLMRHSVTYNWGLHPNTDPALLEYNRGEFSTKAIGSESYLYEIQGKWAVPYGNFSGSSNWNTFDAVPRYTTNYSGLRNRLALLLEVYSHDPYTVRVDTQYACIYGTLLTVQEDADKIHKLIADADEYALTRAEQWAANGEKDKVSLRPQLVPLEYGEHESIKENGKMDVHSYQVSSGLSVINTQLRSNGTNSSGGFRVGTVFAGEAELEVTNNGKFNYGETVDMGAYYLFDADCTELVTLMDKHGIEMTQLSEPLTLAADKFEWFNVTNVNTSDPAATGSYYEGRLRSSSTTGSENIRGSWQTPVSEQVFPVGTYVVSTAQVRGALAALLLEPASIDGAACWNLVDAQMEDLDNPGMVRNNEAYACTVAKFGGGTKTVAMPIFKVGSFDALPEAPVANLQLTTEAKDVKAGDEFTVRASFKEMVSSNAAILDFTFDKDKFEYREFIEYKTPAMDSETAVLFAEETDHGVRITIMTLDARTLVYGDLKLAAKEGGVLADEKNEIKVLAQYVVKPEAGDKHIITEKASTIFNTIVIIDPPIIKYDLLTLSDMIDAFGLTSEDPNWDKIKIFDLIPDGQINIDDVALFASKIGKE